MRRYITPIGPDGRLSNGWWPQLLDEWLAYGNGNVWVLNIRTGTVTNYPPDTGRQSWPVGLVRATLGTVRLGVTTELPPGNLDRTFQLINVVEGIVTPAIIDPATRPQLYTGRHVWGVVPGGAFFRDGLPFTFPNGQRFADQTQLLRGREGYLLLAQPDRNWRDALVDEETGQTIRELPSSDCALVVIAGQPYVSFVSPEDWRTNVLVAPGSTVRMEKPDGADWVGVGVPAIRRGQLWLWLPCEGGYNEQSFVIGRRIEDVLNGDDRGLVLEMPSSSLQVGYDEATDAWAVAGMARGLHGTPDYADGTLHCVSEIPGDTARVTLRSQLTPFSFPLRIPASLVCDVWTFGDDIPGTIGGGTAPNRPQRQGVGIDADGTPWFNVDDPSVLGVWCSPDDDAHGLGALLESDTLDFGPKLDRLIAAYQLTDLRDELFALARANRESLNSWPLDRRMSVALCRRKGYSLTLYSDQQPDDREAGYFGPKAELVRLRDEEQIAVIAGVNVYIGPIGAEWKLDQVIADAKAATEAMPDRPFLIALTLGRYTGRDPNTGVLRWQPTAVARRLEWALHEAVRHEALCLDVFGVGRRGELPEFTVWGDRWLRALILQMPTANRARWPRTAPPIVPPVEPTKPPVTLPTTGTATGHGGIAGGRVTPNTLQRALARLSAWWKKRTR